MSLSHYCISQETLCSNLMVGACPDYPVRHRSHLLSPDNQWTEYSHSGKQFRVLYIFPRCVSPCTLPHIFGQQSATPLLKSHLLIWPNSIYAPLPSPFFSDMLSKTPRNAHYSYELVLWDADLGMPLSFTQDIFSKAILMNIIVGTAWISVLSMLYYPTLQSPLHAGCHWQPALHAKAKTKVYRGLAADSRR